MKYLCLIYDEERDWDALPPEQSAAYLAECMAAEDGIRAAGHHRGSQALLPAATGAIVRIRNGKLSVTDGPFMETREQLAGFYLVEAADRDEAARLAATIPSARTGCIEVRPVVDFAAAG